jgi:hypothetical protein
MALFIAIPAEAYMAIAAGSPELKERNGHKVIGFDAAAVESVTFKAVIPSTYASGSNVTGKVRWLATSATSGNVRTRLEFERVNTAGTDLDADSFATAVEANAAADATAGKLFEASFTLANADLDAVAAGDAVRIKVSRVGTDGTNDTMTGDAELYDLTFSQ